MERKQVCPDCEPSQFASLTRRDFVKAAGATATVATAAMLPRSSALAGEKEQAAPEPLVKKLYDSLNPEQKKEVCFAWDHADEDGVLRSHVAANWHITKPTIQSEFFTKDQQDSIEAIYFGLYNPDWHDRIKKQLQDDAGGYGKSQNIAIFGEPGTGTFEFVMTGRHLTIRCDGDSNDHMAFGGPIFYGHAASGFNEKPGHPGNVFWHQALKANALFEMLDGKQRELALIPEAPEEHLVHFRAGEKQFPGIPIAELSGDQKEHVQVVLESLIEPYRTSDRDEAVSCLKDQGGLDKCGIAFYKSGDIGDDGVWDVWRLEGPSFVWHWRGSPHVHVWVNVASDPSVKITTG